MAAVVGLSCFCLNLMAYECNRTYVIESLQKSYQPVWVKPYLVPSVLVICFRGSFVVEGALSR